MWKETQKIGAEEYVYGIVVAIFLIVVILFLSSCRRTTKDANGREYELKERCIVGRYSDIYSECGTVIECDSSVIDTFWIRKKPKRIW